MKLLSYITALLVCLVSVSAFGASVSVTASVDQSKITLEDEIYLTVTVHGSRKATEPVLPSMPAFKVIPSGTTSSIQIINGRLETKKQYSYILIPQEEGDFTINPVSVFLEGREYRSRALNIEIKKSGYAAPAPGFDPFQEDAEEEEPFEEPIQKETRPYWITVKVSNSDPYVNEQVLYTFRFYTRVNVGTATLNLPEFIDFWSEEVVPEKKYYQTIGGRKHVVSEKVVALYPLKSGEIEIPETVLRIEVAENTGRSLFNDPFFNMGRVRTRPKYLRARPIALNVKPLPSGRPDNFTNLVGQFGLSVNLSNPEIKMGESTTMSIELSGMGNIKDAVLPFNPQLSAFKVYDDKPVTDTVRSEKGIQGTKSFKRALVPTQSGEFTIPTLTVSYFNPRTEQYESLESPALSVRVLPSSEETLNPVIASDQPVGTKTTSLIAEDIATIHTGSEAIRSQRWGFTVKSVVVAGLFIPPFLFFGTLFFQKRQEHRKEYAALYKSRLAYRNFQKDLHKIQRSRVSDDQALNQLLEDIREYVGDRCEVFGGALTTVDITAQLEARGVGRDLTARLNQMIHELEYARYGGEKTRKSSGNWFREASHLIRSIDKKIKSKIH